MLGIVSEDENQNKIFKPMAGATLGQGVPLGTWCSFEKDVAPSNNWLMAGTTFDASVYPALNLYLGTNVVPSRYDHNRPSELKSFVPYGQTVIPFTAQYDAEVIVTAASSNARTVTVNGETVCNITSSDILEQITVSLKKGDIVTVTGTSSITAYEVTGFYYTHPLFIKATSIASDTDQQAILAQIQAYNTYSTEETLTGKTWIDGKPIYRLVIEYNGSISGTSTVTLADLLPSANYVDTAINGRAIGLRDNNNLKKMSVSLDWWLSETNTKNVSVQVLSTIYCKQITLEYTKTTD